MPVVKANRRTSCGGLLICRSRVVSQQSLSTSKRSQAMTFAAKKPVRQVFRPYYTRRGDERCIVAGPLGEHGFYVLFGRRPTYRDLERGKPPQFSTERVLRRNTVVNRLLLTRSTAENLWYALNELLFPHHQTTPHNNKV